MNLAFKRHQALPAMPRMSIIRAAPELLPLPKSEVSMAEFAWARIKGSHTLSTIKPPRKSPIGLVKN